MGFIKAGLGVGVAAFAGATLMLSDGPESGADRSPVAVEMPARHAAERFRLVLSGNDTGCDVVKGDSISAGKARLIFDADCAGELPDIADSRFWTEEEDGSVAFTGEDGRVSIRFAAGDGHAFESYGVGAPLIALIAED